MKLLSKIFFTGAIALVALNACKKKDDPAPTPTKPKGVMSATINGKAWQSDPANKFMVIDGDTVYGADCTLEADTLQILAMRFSDTSAILGQLVLTAGRTGTYSGTSTADAGLLYLKKLDLAGIFTALLGYTTTYNVNITSWDATNKKFSGTYSFTMTNNTPGQPNIEVKSGEFTDLPYEID